MKAWSLKISSPCKDCEKRHRACWSECEAYQEYLVKKDELKMMRYKDINLTMRAYEHDAKTKALRKKQRMSNYKVHD